MKPRVIFLAVAASAVAAVSLMYHMGFRRVERRGGPLPHEAYVWQRRWDERVARALGEGADRVSAFTVLAAEVSWRRGRPRVVRVPLDYGALKRTGRPVGLALRIGPYAGPFEEKTEATLLLTELAASLIGRARDAGLEPAELQIDFDCAESRLDGYRSWVEALRQSSAGVPLTITALPCWLKHRAFARLARASGGFVLQVHSLARPASADTPMTLCDAAAALRWVERAARTGVPFRVALPTYGYVVAFGSDGRFIGVSAEGPLGRWGPDVTCRTVAADPFALAELVETWRMSRPATLTGILWYRLPVEGDRLNWTWTTLAAVMSGRAPRRRLDVQVVYPQAELAEVELVNTGEVDLTPDVTVRLEWRTGALVAADALRGFSMSETAPRHRSLQAGRAREFVRMAPGERWTIAWLRFTQETEVQAHAHATDH
ncbi:MAG TPA: DUF3142 domain-containing protein [Planctomycetota bacterium]|nr:DUF3142 domain-containing protein [Planctomycetota bacterium]